MQRPPARLSVTLLLATLPTGTALAQQNPPLRITEILADNDSGLADRDRFRSDWIELHNPNDAAVPMAGYQLVDRSEQPWTFPAVVLPPRGYLVVHASGKDRRELSGELHAGFRLRRGGDTVRLLAPDGSEVDALEFGPQSADVSVGREQDEVARVLLAADAQGRFALPDAKTGDAWRTPGFDDSGWQAGHGGFGFVVRDGDPLARLIRTDLAALRGQGTSICYRIPFDAADLRQIDVCFLRLAWDGGCVVWLNGIEVARRRAPDKLNHESRAVVHHDPRDPGTPDEIPIAAFRDLLRPAGNVLAIQALLERPFAEQHLVQAEIVGLRCGPVVDGPLRHFAQPSPGRPNGKGLPTVAPAVRIEPPGGLLTGPTQVELTCEGDGEIRYTLDGSEPGAGSPRYRSPLQVAGPCTVRARCFRPDAVTGPVATAVFAALDPDLSGFASNLPLLVVSTVGQPVGIKSYVDAQLHVVEVDAAGRAALPGTAHYSGPAALKVRGSSSLILPKKSYGLELRNRRGQDRAVELLGLPAHSDWVLHGPHRWDESHLRNAVCYELARRIGLPAPRARFVELFVNPEARPTGRQDYVGLYLLVESIAVGKRRLDIEPLDHTHTAEPDLSGGYLFKIDRLAPGENGFRAMGLGFQYVKPSEAEITEPQRQWLREHLEQFGKALAGPAMADGPQGYAAFIDVDNFIDYHLFNEFTDNPDAYTLSTFVHKPRGQRLRMGPVWDHDRSFRTNAAPWWVGRAASLEGWTTDCYFGWWGLLFRDAEFRARYRARGRRLLAGEFSAPRLHELVDSLAAVIAEAQQRDHERWPIWTAGEWHDSIARLKQWITGRVAWFDSELLEAPEITSSSGGTAIPTTLTMRHGNAGGTLYFTLDGADPRLQSGAVSPHAAPYREPVVVTRDTLVRARVLVDGIWSRLVEQGCHGPLPDLAITEVMYNPPGGRDYEFVEILNFGSTPVDLRDLRLLGTVEFAFRTGEIQVLPPGERLVVVQDMAAFTERYDTAGIRIAGAYLGNCSNTEGQLVLVGAANQEIARARYLDSWLPPTDGGGFSLVARQPGRNVTNQADWQRSPEPNGSPGR